MTTTFVSRRLSALLFALSLQVVFAAIALAEEKSAEATATGPQLGTQAADTSATSEATAASESPEKPETTEYDLRYKLKRGDVLRYDVTHRATIQSTIEGTSQSAETKTRSVKVWKVTDVLPSGEIEFMNVVERVHMVNQLPDRESAEYNSETDKTPPPGFEDAARSVGVPLSVVRIEPSGKVVRRDVRVRGQNSENDAPIVVRLPEKPVAIGHTWDELFDVQVTLEQGGTKSIQTRRRHKLASVKNGIATIEVTYQVLSPMDSHIESQLVQRLMEGAVRFDVELGRIVGQQMDVDRRILGFAGPTSSMQYVMRMEEKLLKEEPKVASKPVAKSAVKRVTEQPTKFAPTPPGEATAKKAQSPRPTQPRTANGQRKNQATRTYRR